MFSSPTLFSDHWPSCALLEKRFFALVSHSLFPTSILWQTLNTLAVKVFHNASIMNAVGACGLQLYRFGEAVSIVFFEPNWRPDSFYGETMLAPPCSPPT